MEIKVKTEADPTDQLHNALVHTKWAGKSPKVSFEIKKMRILNLHSKCHTQHCFIPSIESFLTAALVYAS